MAFNALPRKRELTKISNAQIVRGKMLITQKEADEKNNEVV